MNYEIPETMKAWVLGDPGVLTLEEKPVPQPKKSEVLVKIDAVAICATDLEIIENGPPAMIQGGLPFKKGFTPGHEYMGTVVKLGDGVDEYKVGDRVAVEIHAGCSSCERCREGMYTSCLNYGKNYEGNDKGHRANGFTTDGGFAEYAINNVNTLCHVGDNVTDEEATLIVTAGTAMYGLDTLGGLIAGQSVVVILTGTRDNRLELGKKLGADYTVNVRNQDVVKAVKEITNGEGVHYVMECSGAPNAVNEAANMVKRGGRICLAAFPSKPVEVDVAALVRNNISLFGIRGEGRSAVHRAASLISEKRLDASLIHTHTFGFGDLLTALKYSKERIDDAIKVVVKNPG